jgi:predicted Zn-dependent protease with MMP-like domain
MTTTRRGASDLRSEQLLDRAEEALDDGDADDAVELCERVLRSSPDHPGALFLLGEAFRQLGDLESAVARYQRVTQLDPRHSSSWSGQAFCLFDLLDFERARSAAARAIRDDDGNPEAYYVRALLRERRGDYDGARRDFTRAALIDPEAWPMPVELSDGMVDAVVQETLEVLHPTLRTYLEQVPILLEEVPTADLCMEFDPPAPPGEILGVFTGASLKDRASDDPWSRMPPTIVLFRRNLQRVAHDPQRVVEELRITVFHEVGHFLGLDEEDLEARGID